jgi:hypothetical protein
MGRPDLAEALDGLAKAYLKRVFAVITSEVGRPSWRLMKESSS